MSYYETQRTSSYSRLMKLSTMVRIRWLGILGQSAAVLLVGVYFAFPMPLGACLGVIALSAALNVFLPLFHPCQHRMTPISTTLILGFDIIALALLLYLTGGLSNPFSLLLMAPAVLGAGSLAIGYIVSLNLLAIVSATLLIFFHLPRPWYIGEEMIAPNLLIFGIWAAIISTLLFVTAYSYRIAEEARQLADALAATELALQHEQHLSILDGLAAAAAHELGTPLATIQLVARELHHQLGHDLTHREDMELLISQSQRCRDILQRLTTLSTEGDQHLGQLKLTSALEEVVAPHRDFGIDISSRKIDSDGDEPIIERHPGILYSLGNLVENAVDFARSRVMIDYQWTNEQIMLTITDDGKGFPTSLLGRIGEPYMSMRFRNTKAQDERRGLHGGGLGLGLFIAKTLLERSGAQVRFGNSKDKNFGARVMISWHRSDIEKQQLASEGINARNNDPQTR